LSTVILDNYDSFTFNLYQLVAQLQGGKKPHVFRNDEITVAELEKLQPKHIIISPGPGNPVNHASLGICRDVILELGAEIPILGVCLGHLAMIEALGGCIERSPEPRHGKTSPVIHDGQGVFKSLPTPMEAMRYHSLIGTENNLPDELKITARTSDGLIMGIQHRKWPMHGVQFHPESIGTPLGMQLVGNFIMF